MREHTETEEINERISKWKKTLHTIESEKKLILDEFFQDFVEPTVRFLDIATEVIDKLDREKCDHLNIVPRRDLSWYCKDCGYETFKDSESSESE